MRFTFAYGLMSRDLGALDPALLKATETEKENAVAAKNLAAERIDTTLWPAFDRTNAVQQPSDRVEALLHADYEILRLLGTEEKSWEKARRYSWLLAFYCDDSMFERIGTNLLDHTKAPEIYRTGFAASFDRFAHTSFGEDAQDYLDDAFDRDREGMPSARLRDWIVLTLKHQFQRPRPYQFAFDNGDDTFRHKVSQKAHSPSLPSGHAFDAAFAAIVVAERIDAISQWAPYRDQFPAWAANYGDLRNYAGLHFPSDNWASWIAVATIIDVMFSVPAAKAAKPLLVANIKLSRCFQLARQMDAFKPATDILVALLGPLD